MNHACRLAGNPLSDPNAFFCSTCDISDSGCFRIGISLLTVQVVGRKYSALFGFGNETDAVKAAALIKKAAAPVQKR